MDDSGKTYKLIELVGVSETSTEDAIRRAIAQASQTLKGWLGTRSRRPVGSSKTATSLNFR